MIDAIVLLGIQGSGKGTQAKLLAAEMGYQHINIGDLLREQVSLDTEVGRQVRSTIEKGDMVQDDIVFEIIRGAVSEDCPGIVFDGFPRRLSQAEHLIKYFHLVKVYYLDLEKGEVVKRILGRRVCSQCGANYHLKNKPPKIDGICDLCGSALITRVDDEPQAITKRVNAFYRKTYALKDYFEKMGLLVDFNAEKPIKDIHKQILSDINPD